MHLVAAWVALLLPSTASGSNESDSVVERHLHLRGPGLLEASLDGGVDSVKARKRRDQLAKTLEDQRARLRTALGPGGLEMTGDYRHVVNAVRVKGPASAMAPLASHPDVLGVLPVGRFELLSAEAVPRIGAPELWARTASVTGRGIRVAIVDTGIDYLHAAFGGPGPGAHRENDPTLIEPGSFPTARVVGGIDLVGDRYRTGGTPEPDPDPLECGGSVRPHGTLMASALGGGGVTPDGRAYSGPYGGDNVAFRIGPGVAPEVELLAVKVTGCGDGSTDRALEGLEWLVDPNGDGDFSDRPDIASLSWGSHTQFLPTMTEMAVNNLIAAGMVVVAGNGNVVGGRGYFASLAPASAPAAISVGGTYNEELRYERLVARGPAGGVLEAAVRPGSRAPSLSEVGALRALLGVPPNDLTACTPIGPALEGQIAMIVRGDCSYATKLTHVADSGAVAAVMIDDGISDQPALIGTNTNFPVGMVRKDEGDAILELIATGLTLGELDPDAPFPSLGPDAVTVISSRGPSPRNGILKPDLVAPADPVTLAEPGTGNQARTGLGGSSVATAFTAGAAALLMQQHPGWTPPDIKAALMNRAEPVVDLEGVDYPLTLGGAGRLSVLRSVDTPALMRSTANPEQVSLSFGSIVAGEATTVEQTFEVRNLSSRPQSYRLRPEFVRPVRGVSATVEPSQFELPPEGTITASLRLTVEPTALPPPEPDRATNARASSGGARHFLVEAGGYVRLLGAEDEEVGHLPFFSTVRAGHRITPRLEWGCSDEPVQMHFDGAEALPNLTPVIGVFYRIVGEEGRFDMIGANDGEDGIAHLALGTSETYVTPALVGNPLLKMIIDVDGDDAFETVLELDGLDGSDGAQAEIRDLLRTKMVVGRYSPFQTYPYRHLNELRPDEAVTFPYFTDLWILSYDRRAIGIDLDGPGYQSVLHFGPEQNRFSVALAATFDGTRPLTTPALAAGTSPRALNLSEATQLMVAVMTGDDGWRKIPVDIDRLRYISSELTLTASAAPSGAGQAKVTVRVQNEAEEDGQDLVLSLLDEADPNTVLATETLSRLGPAESTLVTFDALAIPAEGRQLSVRLNARCTAELSASVELSAPENPGDDAPPGPDEEGCACRATGPSSGHGLLLWALIVGLSRRSRRRRDAVHQPSKTQPDVPDKIWTIP